MTTDILVRTSEIKEKALLDLANIIREIGTVSDVERLSDILFKMHSDCLKIYEEKLPEALDKI